MIVAFKLKDEFAAAANRKDFSSRELSQLQGVLKGHGLSADMSPFYAGEKNPDVFCSGAEKYSVSRALEKDTAFQEKVVMSLQACDAVEKVFLRPMMN